MKYTILEVYVHDVLEKRNVYLTDVLNDFLSDLGCSTTIISEESNINHVLQTEKEYGDFSNTSVKIYESASLLPMLDDFSSFDAVESLIIEYAMGVEMKYIRRRLAKDKLLPKYFLEYGEPEQDSRNTYFMNKLIIVSRQLKINEKDYELVLKLFKENNIDWSL